jgi:hypothetical protein
MINENVAQEILHELFSSLEGLETQCTAMLQFLKDKGIAREEELAVHFEQAGNASSVRWRAARVRIDHLLSSALKAEGRESAKAEERKPPKAAERESPRAEEREAAKSSENSQQPPRKEPRQASPEREPEQEAQGTEQPAASGKSEEDDAKASARNKQNDQDHTTSKRPEDAAA